LPIFTVSSLQDSTARAFNWIDLALLPAYIAHPLTVIVVTGGFWLAGGAVSAVTTLATACAAFWVVVVVQMVLLDRYERLYWLKTALPLFIVDSFFILLTYVDTLVLQAFVGPAAIAVYYAATKTLALVNFIYFAVLPLLDESGPVARALCTAVEGSDGAHALYGRHRGPVQAPRRARSRARRRRSARRHARRADATARRRCAALRPDGDAAHYVARAIGKKRHKEFQRLRRRLAEAEPVAFKVARGPAAVAAALQDFLALEAKGWKGGAGTALIQAPELRRFAETAVDALGVQGQAGVARLVLGSRPIACVVTLESAGGAWCWKIAYDESLARFSPGVQVMMELTDALLADQTVAFADSCATPDHPMIDHLWRERFTMADLMIGLQPGAGFAAIPPGVGAPPRLLLGTRRSRPLAAVDRQDGLSSCESHPRRLGMGRSAMHFAAFKPSYKPIGTRVKSAGLRRAGCRATCSARTVPRA
jgi:hypothetical protein